MTGSAIKNKQLGENWLDPTSRARITCHEITWCDGDAFNYMQAGGGLYFHNIPRSGTMPHSHEFIEVLLVSGGGLLHRVNGDTLPLETGDICFLRPDDTHSYAPDGEHGKTEILMLDFDTELPRALARYFGDDAVLRRMNTPALPPVFKMDAAALSSLYYKLLRLNSPGSVAANSGEGAPSINVKMKTLVCELFAKFFAEDIAPPDGALRIPRWLEVLCAQMSAKENFAAGFPRLCKLAYRTPGHICKAFRKYLHKSPTEFINELRLNHAAWQLADTNTDILEIAQDLNFQSLSRFYALFRKKYGVPPAAYRRMHSPERQF